MRILTIRGTSTSCGLAALALVGCGGAPIPHSQNARTQAAVSAAEAVGAASIPRGALHLKLAQDQLNTAQSLIAEGQNEEARLVLQRAEADAQLAVVLARAAEAKAEADRALASVHRLEQSAHSSGGR